MGQRAVLSYTKHYCPINEGISSVLSSEKAAQALSNLSALSCLNCFGFYCRYNQFVGKLRESKNSFFNLFGHTQPP